MIQQLGIINTARKKDTLRYRVAHPLTILINQDSTVAAVVSNATGELPDSKQLIAAWAPIKPDDPDPNLPLISVVGNKFVDPSGQQVLFKGIAIADPHKIANDGHWNRKHFETIKSWGANLIRIPVHPAHLRRRGEENYLDLLDQAVSWCGELEMHVIIDWHSIGNLREEKFEAPEYKTDLKETLKFWDTISKRFAGNPTIAFYEVYNEPSVNFGKWGTCTWPQWKAILEQCIDVIYANDQNVIPLVAGFDWAYDLREAKNSPIDRPGVAYVAHPYPGKSRPPREAHWEEHFGFMADRFPVIVSETGYYLKGEHKHLTDEGSFRNALLKYLDKKKISWCAWVFDPDWSPPLIKNYHYQPTHSGAFFRDALRNN